MDPMYYFKNLFEVAKTYIPAQGFDTTKLRIRIPPDRLAYCGPCTFVFSLAHASSCPGCTPKIYKEVFVNEED